MQNAGLQLGRGRVGFISPSFYFDGSESTMPYYNP